MRGPEDSGWAEVETPTSFLVSQPTTILNRRVLGVDAPQPYKKMRKVIFLMAAFCLNCGVVKSQVSDAVIATLQHGDSLQTFDGYYALSNAFNAAESGDVITLTSGVFYGGIDITKSVTIIGAGFESDEEENLVPTVLENNFDIYSSGSGTSIEGVWFDDRLTLGASVSETVSNVNLIKVRGPIYLYSNTSYVSIRQSVSTDFCIYNRDHANLCFVGSHININNSYHLTGANSIYLDHCILPDPIRGTATYTNCIIGSNFSSYGGSVLSSCILFGDDVAGDLEKFYITGTNIYYNLSYTDVFEEEISDLSWDDVKTFKLKSSSNYASTDDTEIGIYGGEYSYNPTPTVPQITDFTLDDSDIANGTLKVSVTAEAQTEY